MHLRRWTNRPELPWVGPARPGAFRLRTVVRIDAPRARDALAARSAL